MTSRSTTPRPPAPPCPDSAGLARVAARLGWAGTAGPEVRLLGMGLYPVAVLDHAAHAERARCGDGPMLDVDTLTMWEWPQATGRAPRSVVRLVATLHPVRRSLTAAVAAARVWRALGPAAVWAPPAWLSAETRDGQTARWNATYAGVGLTTDTLGPVSGVIPAEPGRSGLPGRRRLERWIEESVYAAVLTAGHFTHPTATVTPGTEGSR